MSQETRDRKQLTICERISCPDFYYFNHPRCAGVCLAEEGQPRIRKGTKECPRGRKGEVR